MVQPSKELRALSMTEGKNAVNLCELSDWSAVVRHNTRNDAVQRGAERQPSCEGGVSRSAEGCKSPLVPSVALVRRKEFYTESDCGRHSFQSEYKQLDSLVELTPTRFKKFVSNMIQHIKREAEDLDRNMFVNEHPVQEYNNRVSKFLAEIKMEVIADRKRTLAELQSTGKPYWETVVSNKCKVLKSATGVKRYIDPSGYSRWSLQGQTKNVTINGLKSFSRCMSVSAKYDSANRLGEQAVMNLGKKHGDYIAHAKRITRCHTEQVELNSICSRAQQIANSVANRALQKRNNHESLMQTLKRRNGMFKSKKRKYVEVKTNETDEIEPNKPAQKETKNGFYARVPLHMRCLKGTKAVDLFEAVASRNGRFNERPGYSVTSLNDVTSRPGFILDGKALFAVFSEGKWNSSKALSLANLSHWRDEQQKFAHRYGNDVHGTFLRKDQCAYGAFCSAFRIDPEAYTDDRFAKVANTTVKSNWSNDDLIKNIVGIGHGALLFEAQDDTVVCIVIEPDAAFMHHNRAKYSYPVLATVSAVQNMIAVGSTAASRLLPSVYKKNRVDHWMCLNRVVPIEHICKYYDGEPQFEAKCVQSGKHDLDLKDLEATVKANALPVSQPSIIPVTQVKKADNKNSAQQLSDKQLFETEFDELAHSLTTKVRGLHCIHFDNIMDHDSTMPVDLSFFFKQWYTQTSSEVLSLHNEKQEAFDISCVAVDNQARYIAAKEIMIQHVNDIVTTVSSLSNVVAVSKKITEKIETVKSNKVVKGISNFFKSVKFNYDLRAQTAAEVKTDIKIANDAMEFEMTEVKNDRVQEWIKAVKLEHNPLIEMPFSESESSPLCIAEALLQQNGASLPEGKRLFRTIHNMAHSVRRWPFNFGAKYIPDRFQSIWCIATFPIVTVAATVDRWACRRMFNLKPKPVSTFFKKFFDDSLEESKPVSTSFKKFSNAVHLVVKTRQKVLSALSTQLTNCRRFLSKTNGSVSEGVSSESESESNWCTISQKLKNYTNECKRLWTVTCKSRKLRWCQKPYVLSIIPVAAYCNLYTSRSFRCKVYPIIWWPVKLLKNFSNVFECLSNISKFMAKRNGSFAFMQEQPLPPGWFPMVPRIINGRLVKMPFVGPSMKNAVYVPFNTIDNAVYHTEYTFDGRYKSTLMVNSDQYSKSWPQAPNGDLDIVPWIVDGDHTVYAHRAIVIMYGFTVINQARPPYRIINIDKKDRIGREKFRFILPDCYSELYSKMTGSIKDVDVYATAVKNVLTQAPTRNWIRNVRTHPDTCVESALSDAIVLDMQMTAPGIINNGNSELDNVYLEYKHLIETRDYRKLTAIAAYISVIATRPNENVLDKAMRLYYFLSKDGSSSKDKFAAFSLAYERCTITSTTDSMFTEFFMQYMLKNIALSLIEAGCSIARDYTALFDAQAWIKDYVRVAPLVDGFLGGCGINNSFFNRLTTAIAATSLTWVNNTPHIKMARAVIKYVSKVQIAVRAWSWAMMWKADFTSYATNKYCANNAQQLRQRLLPTKPVAPLPMTGYVVNDLQISVGL